MIFLLTLVISASFGALLAIRSHLKFKKQFDNLMVLFEENRRVANQLIRRLKYFNIGHGDD